MKIDELIVGEIYIAKYQKYSWIWRHDAAEERNYKSGTSYLISKSNASIDLEDQTYDASNQHLDDTGTEFHPATEQERIWLFACISRGTFVPASESFKIEEPKYDIFS